MWLRRTGHGGRAAAAELGAHAGAAALGRSASGLRVVHHPGGRPGLTGAAGHLQVSLSHSRAMAAAAVTTLGPVGVDLEQVRRVDAVALARRWFPAAEAAWLALLPAGQRDEAFLGLWTQKEAIAKALGTGLRGGAGLRQPVPLSRPRPGQPGLRLAGGPGTELAGGPGTELTGWSGMMRLAAVPGRPGLAAAAAALAGRAVLAVACLGAGADGAVITIRLAAGEPAAR